MNKRVGMIGDGGSLGAVPAAAATIAATAPTSPEPPRTPSTDDRARDAVRAAIDSYRLGKRGLTAPQPVARLGHTGYVVMSDGSRRHEQRKLTKAERKAAKRAK